MTPACACHSEPMYWKGKSPDAGYWICWVRKRETDRQYRSTANGRARRRVVDRAYKLTDKGRAARRRERLRTRVKEREAQITRLEELMQQ